MKKNTFVNKVVEAKIGDGTPSFNEVPLIRWSDRKHNFRWALVTEDIFSEPHREQIYDQGPLDNQMFQFVSAVKEMESIKKTAGWSMFSRYKIELIGTTPSRRRSFYMEKEDKSYAMEVLVTKFDSRCLPDGRHVWVQDGDPMNDKFWLESQDYDFTSDYWVMDIKWTEG